MRIVKEILGRIFAVWGMIIFAGSLLIASIPIWITTIWPEPKRTINFFKVVHVWMNFFFTFSGVRRIVKGREHFKKGQNYVVVCNHNSFMDVPLSVTAVPPNKTIAKIEMAKIPVFGMIYKRGSVLVDRKNEESRRKSFLKMKNILEMGLHMCIYPEGTRNKTSEPLQRFHDGAFKLAVETKKEIIPALIFYTSKVLPRKPFFFWPHKVELHFLPAVAVENKTSQQLKEEVFNIMKNYLLNSGKWEANKK
ncbi:MAG TPA: lysophospholipid acyltransferase family protein [Flavisolibacter sp.]|nr:lysophospholipid acyltransferase family protein [Flavisolibacter sp.]